MKKKTTSFVLLLFLLLVQSVNFSEQREALKPKVDKLLIVVLGGFRWDYQRLFSMRSRKPFPGFEEFQREGVRAKYIKSVFPSDDFPSWQTINTGTYPSKHGIIGDTFYDPMKSSSQHRRHKNPYFDGSDERRTGEIRWWQKVEPIWATAEKQGIQFTTLLWGRCDIPWHDTNEIKPGHCESVYEKDNSKTLAITLETALIHFQKGQDAALIYDDSLKVSAAKFGPLSKNVENTLRTIDRYIQNFLKRLRVAHMDKSVNVVVLSDHGMTYGSDPLPSKHHANFRGTLVRKPSIGRALHRVTPKVHMVVGSGASAAVYPRDHRFVGEIMRELRKGMAGCDVYTSDEIPEELHYRNNFNTPPILVIARPGVVIIRAGSNLQRPPSIKKSHGGDEEAAVLEQTKQGISGYDPEEPDMRGAFMARGPGFKSDGNEYGEVELVDMYEMFCFLLGIEPGKNEGVWERVRQMLKNGAISALASPSLLITLIPLLTLTWS